MPDIDKMKNSNYLSKGDVDPPITVTIKDCVEKDVSMENQPEEMKWVLSFVEDYLPMVLNWTNTSMIAAIVGERNSDFWAGKRITLWNDPSIMYMKKLTGGIRVKADLTTARGESALVGEEPPPEAPDEPPF